MARADRRRGSRRSRNSGSRSRHSSDRPRRHEHSRYREWPDQPQSGAPTGYGHRQDQYDRQRQYARQRQYQYDYEDNYTDEPQISFGRFCRLTFFGSLIPGTGLIAAGRRIFGGFVLALCFLMVAAGAAAIILVPTTRLLSYGGDREVLLYAGVGLVAGAVAWTLIALITHRSLEPRGLSPGKRFVGSLMVVLAASVVVAPMAVAARNAFTQRDLIGAISGDGEDSKTTPEDIKEEDPWADMPRLNLLLLGADVGKGRDEESEGIRPDTQIVASIDTKTGDTSLISMPRNLGNVPFPEDSDLYELYPNGFVPPTGMPSTSDPEYANWELNAIWKNVPAFNPDLDILPSDANKWAAEGVLGLNIDYYMMVNLDGFEAIVDALGGITIDVSEEVPIHYGEPDSYCLSRALEFIQPGEQEMDGSLALMYARSRCGADNYTRMDRQQCVIQGIVEAAKPQKLLTKYQSLARATKGMVKTDIPADLFPAIIQLTAEVQGGDMETLSLNTEFFNKHGGESYAPDYEAIHQAVDKLINPEPKPTKTGGATDGADSSIDSSEPSTDEGTDETSASGEIGDPNAPKEEESTC